MRVTLRLRDAGFERGGERVLDREVRGRVRRDVLLEGVVVEVLLTVGEVGARDGRFGPRAGEIVLDPDLALLRAEAARNPVQLRVTLDAGVMGRKVPRLAR